MLLSFLFYRNERSLKARKYNCIFGKKTGNLEGAQGGKSNALTIGIFIVMQKCELMLDADTIGRGQSARYKICKLDGRRGQADKNNKRDRLHVFVHRWIHKNIRANTLRVWWWERQRQKDETPRGATIPRFFPPNSQEIPSPYRFSRIFLIVSNIEIPASL